MILSLDGRWIESSKQLAKAISVCIWNPSLFSLFFSHLQFVAFFLFVCCVSHFPGTFCGVLRRQALDRGAAVLKCSQLVTGHNADDMAETVLLNFLRGDITRLERCVDIKTSELSENVCAFKRACSCCQRTSVRSRERVHA